MGIAEHSESVQVDRLLQLRERQEIDRLDYMRELRHEFAHGRTQSAIAQALRISQSAVSQQLDAAKKIPEAAPGFAGAGPYEIAQRYAAGLLSHGELLEQLGRWEYASNGTTDGYDALRPSHAGSWDEVVAAHADGLIDDETYGAILDRAAAAFGAGESSCPTT